MPRPPSECLKADPYAGMEAASFHLWCDSPLLPRHYGTPHSHVHVPFVRRGGSTSDASGCDSRSESGTTNTKR